MEYYLNMGIWGHVFAVPSCVVEEYLKLARGSDIKVLLYILHNNSNKVDINLIADSTDLSSETVEEAFLFWEQVGLLSKEKQPNKQAIIEKEPSVESKPVQREKIKRNSVITISPREISLRVQESDEIKYLFEYAEKSLGDTLTNTQQRSLLWMRDYLNLPVDVIVMLIEYCKMIGKLNVNYIEKVATNWCERDIITHETAETEIEKCIKCHSFESKVISAFGLNRKITTKEHDFINLWSENDFTIELISLAYEKTVDAINKLSFPYINKILFGWKEKGLLSVDMIENSNKKGKSTEEHAYDLDKFDKLALNVSSNGSGV